MVTALIKDFKIEDNLIWALVEYNIGGDKVVNPYPMQKSNIVGLPVSQVQAWLDINIIFTLLVYNNLIKWINFSQN